MSAGESPKLEPRIDTMAPGLTIELKEALFVMVETVGTCA
jgi:hypothetical protein